MHLLSGETLGGGSHTLGGGSHALGLRAQGERVWAQVSVCESDIVALETAAPLQLPLVLCPLTCHPSSP